MGFFLEGLVLHIRFNEVAESGVTNALPDCICHVILTLAGLVVNPYAFLDIFSMVLPFLQNLKTIGYHNAEPFSCNRLDHFSRCVGALAAWK
jgi:hypothetical protein